MFGTPCNWANAAIFMQQAVSACSTFLRPYSSFFQNAKEFSWAGVRGWAYNTKEDFSRATAAYVDATGRHGRIKSAKSDIIYYVIEGEGVFTVDSREFPVSRSDVIMVPRNTAFDYRARNGVLKMFLVHSPGRDPDYEFSLEEDK